MAFLPGRPIQQRLAAQGGWPEGDASFSGQNPASGAVITYYQRTRHLYGRMKLEVVDSVGKVVDTLSPTKRRGINRVVWSMQVKAPRVPRAAQVAGAATQGPRVLPGTYAIRLTKGGKPIETKIEVGIDRRATYSAQERKSQFDAAMRAHALFGDMSALTDRIDTMRAAIGVREKGVPSPDPLAQKLGAASKKLEEAKKKVVATKEGGAITGEERIREHLDQLYGALTAWEGRPAKYQVERIDVLKRELGDVVAEVDGIVKKDILPLEVELRGHKLDPIPTTASSVDVLAVAPDPAAVAMVRCLLSPRSNCADAERVAASTQRGERD